MNTRNQNKIKTVLTLAIVLGVFAAFVGSLQAGVFVYEPFDYKGGVAVYGLAASGVGVTGTWNANHTGTLCKIKWGSLNYSTIPVTGMRWGPGAVWCDPWVEVGLEPSAMAGKLDDGDTLWFSVIANNYHTAYINEIEFSIGGMTNGMGFDSDRKTGSESDTVILRAAQWTGGVRTVSKDSVTYTLSGTTSFPRLIVGKIVFGAAEDTIEIYLPEPDLALPASPAGTVTATLDQLAFNKIRSQVTNGNSMLDTDEIRFGDTYDDVIVADTDLPSVNSGIDMITWSGETIQLAPTVVNNDSTIPQGSLSYLWYADDDTGVVFSDETAEAPTVTITKATANPSHVKLTLAVTLEGKDPVLDAMMIDLYDDSCEAAKKGKGLVPDQSDFNVDCQTNIGDLAKLASVWLYDYTITEPVPKP